MKTIIAGTRTFEDYDLLVAVVEESGFDITEVVSGAASGVDTLGEKYAQENGILCTQFHADWNRYGRSAGPRRNAEMAEYAEALILLWDGKSRGSKSMLQEAKKRNLLYFVYVLPSTEKEDMKP